MRVTSACVARIVATRIGLRCATRPDDRDCHRDTHGEVGQLSTPGSARVPCETPLMQAHATSHVVKDLLMARFPQLADVVIHIEPPPASLRSDTGTPQLGRPTDTA